MIKTLSRRLPSYPKWTSSIQNLLATGHTDGDGFYVGNLALVRQQLDRWKSLLPSVEPHYGAFFCMLVAQFAHFLCSCLLLDALLLCFDWC